MKKGIHPENYRPVVFKDMSNDEIFITRSTIAAKDTILYRKAEIGRYGWSRRQVHEPLRKAHAEQTEISISSFIKKTGKTYGFARFLFVWPLCRITVCVPICICQVVWPSCYRRVFLHRQPCLIRISILVIVSEHN